MTVEQAMSYALEEAHRDGVRPMDQQEDIAPYAQL